MKPIIYNGYTIEEDFRNPYTNTPEYIFYPTEEGIQHDADLSGEDMKYCGNCQWATTVQEAKDLIWEACWKRGFYEYEFATFTRGAYAVNETFKAFGRNIDEAIENIEAMIGSKDYRLLSITK